MLSASGFSYINKRDVQPGVLHRHLKCVAVCTGTESDEPLIKERRLAVPSEEQQQHVPREEVLQNLLLQSAERERERDNYSYKSFKHFCNDW